tara:strand:+ start:310 stop:618 length:309 start_codon:yes stop_codon:yes gene_type:complete
MLHITGFGHYIDLSSGVATEHPYMRVCTDQGEATDIPISDETLHELLDMYTPEEQEQAAVGQSESSAVTPIRQHSVDLSNHQFDPEADPEADINPFIVGENT